MKHCSTCEIIKGIKESYVSGGRKVKLNITIKAAVTEEIRKGRTEAGTVRYTRGQMKYCPECGRKLRPCETKFTVKPSSDGG